VPGALQTPPDVPGVTHDWLDAGGLRMHVALAGPEDAPPLLLVHGWPQHWWAWRHVIGDLARTHRVIAPDLRGHGWTDAPRDGYDKQQMASDLLALLDTMGIDRVTWVGHDWGAFTGYLAAYRAPERFERLIAMCVPPPFSRDRSPAALTLVLSYQLPISTPLLGSFIVRHGFTARILRIARARGEWTDEEIAAYDRIFRSRPHVTVGVYRTFLTRELMPLARGLYADRTLEVPTSIVVGDRDAITRSVRPGAYPDQPNVTVRRVDGVGHFLPEEAPEAVLAAVS
jgi:pimeloyl-ACP methyl ester carboxylesterase